MVRAFVMRVGLLLVVSVALSGCAVQKLLNRGDRLLKDGDFTKAIATYEEALRTSPGNKAAHDRIKVARREHVRARLRQAEAALSGGELAQALGEAQRARRMPLDLEDVELVRRIDATIDKAAQLAEDRVRNHIDKGHFLAAVDLSQQIVNASPGVTSREKWAADVRAKAVEHYRSLAASLASEGQFGSAAIQLAAARSLGADVKVAEVRGLWNRFTEPTCFAAPQIEVVDKSGKTKELAAKIKTTALLELERVRAGCGEGSRKLAVRISLATVDILDDVKTTRAAKPLPGASVETEEVYYEEEPYTEVEEVTEYDTRIEKRELRDCAPRPGKERGCSTWIEEVEVKVPIKKTKEVQKVRKLRRTRPIQGPLPEDKVLTYEVTTVSRRVAYEGTITLTGEVDKTVPLAVKRESTDTANAEVSGKGLTIPADPMQAKTMSELAAEAAEAVAEELRRAVNAAATEWAKSYEQQAQKRILAGQLPQAEELYLKELALGAQATAELKRFFDERYGRSVGTVLDLLAIALGREVKATPAGEAQAEGAAATNFPKRGRVEEPAAEDAPVPDTTAQVKDRQLPVTPPPSGGKAAGLSDDEMKALEDASIDALKPPPAAPPPKPEGEQPQVSEEDKPRSAPAPEQTERRPIIVPKKTE